MTEGNDLSPGLYVVATPIGAARDVTLRALDILRQADVIAAEDTRVLRHLLELHGVPVAGRRVVSYHDHNGERRRPELMKVLEEGGSVAQVSDAGTPLVADPGFTLAREALARGIPVHAAPGPSALLAALVVSGLPSDRFLFAGFLPPQSGPRKKALAEFAQVPATLVFYESPKRSSQTLKDMCEILGPEREAALCRELTKRFEETRRGTLAELAQSAEDNPPRGEVVLLVDRDRVGASDEVRDEMLRAALEEMKVKDAAAAVAEKLGLSKRDLYQRALEMKAGD